MAEFLGEILSRTSGYPCAEPRWILGRTVSVLPLHEYLIVLLRRPVSITCDKVSRVQTAVHDQEHESNVVHIRV